MTDVTPFRSMLAELYLQRDELERRIAAVENAIETFEPTPSNGSPKTHPIAVPSPSPSSSPTNGHAPTYPTTLEELLALVRQYPGKPAPYYGRALGLSGKQASSILTRAKAKGLVHLTGEKRGARWFVVEAK